MTEDDCEIEYLDEDEDIVQQCVQSVPIVETKTILDEDIGDVEKQIAPLLVQRKPSENKRKPKVEEEDSDYDPTDDFVPPMKKKRRTQTKKPSKKIVQNSSPTTILTPQKPTPPQQKPRSTFNLLQKQKDLKYDLNERRKLEIAIPNYEDPLCLPARAFKNDGHDVRNLRIWNNLCLEYYQKSDQDLKLDEGRTVGSKRLTVLKNVKNRYSGKVETTIFSKLVVENENGEMKSDKFNSALPSFLERTSPKLFNLYHATKPRKFRNSFEAVLWKEEHKDGDTLVVYKPKEAISAVYKFGDKNNSDGDYDNDEDRRKRSVLKELTCCKMCAPCYQASWRGRHRTNKNSQNIQCHVCSRTFVSVYNLLSHLKTHHSHAEVRRCRELLSQTLANVVDYHYKCRICQEKFGSIKLLRKHIPKHQGTEMFTCEVGNHMAS